MTRWKNSKGKWNPYKESNKLQYQINSRKKMKLKLNKLI